MATHYLWDTLMKYVADSPFSGVLSVKVRGGDSSNSIKFNLADLTVELPRTNTHDENWSTTKQIEYDLEAAVITSLAEKYGLHAGSLGMYVKYTQTSGSDKETREKGIKTLCDFCEDYIRIDNETRCSSITADIKSKQWEYDKTIKEELTQRAKAIIEKHYKPKQNS